MGQTANGKDSSIGVGEACWRTIISADFTLLCSSITCVSTSSLIIRFANQVSGLLILIKRNRGAGRRIKRAVCVVFENSNQIFYQKK